MPEISVIIPTYQHGKTIAACLDSVFRQTFKDMEIIVVNDGSTDDTEAALKPYLNRVIYKKTTNSGSQKARNLGFSLSSGNFVIFLDADIFMKPTMLKELRDILNAHPEASYAYCGFRFGIARFRGEPFDSERLRRINFIHTSALIRRSDFPGFDESIRRFQDWDLWLTMLERGKTGVGVNKILFFAKPREKFGMSQWRPKIFFSELFEALGIRPQSVLKYREAASVIARKHDLELTPRVQYGGHLWLAFLAVFAVSAAAFAYPWLGTAVSILILAAAIVSGRNRLLYGVALLLGELVFGSLAGKTLAFELPGITIPLRFALFGAIGLIWLVRILQKRARVPSRNILIGVAAVLVAVAWGIANGLLHGTPLRDIFFDANAYFALPIILFFASAVETENDQRLLLKILKHGAIALAILTLAALFFFSHRFPNAAGVFSYKWLRDSRIAEITALAGGTYRVFIQSQIFCLFALLWVALGNSAGGWKKWIWGVWPTSVLVVSGSRSFALGFVAALLAWAILISSSLTRQGISTPQSDHQDSSPWKNRPYGLGMTARKLVFFGAISVVAYGALLLFPLPSSRSQASFQEMLKSRSVSERDAATTSRWALLKELNDKIIESPIQGSGFGATVTYRSSDPRIVSTTGGAYTTSAFEWNYHDILIKLGIFGLLAYGFLLWAILRVLLKADIRRRVWLVPAFFALVVLNAVSPYLNHPLGIGYLALLLALAERPPDKPIPVAVLAPSRIPVTSAVPAGVAMSEE
jgi:glycosyltransferase involved in cell wall biosynthesis